MLQRHVARTVAACFTEKTSPRSLRGSWLTEISAPTLRVSALLMANRKFARCVLAFHDQLPSSWLQQKQGVRRCKLPVKRPRRQGRNTGSGYRRLAGTPPKEHFYQCWTLFFTFWRAENRLLKGIAKDVQITYLRVRKNTIPTGSIEQIPEIYKSKCAAD